MLRRPWRCLSRVLDRPPGPPPSSYLSAPSRPHRPLTRSPDPVRQGDERERLFTEKARSHAELAHIDPQERMAALAKRVVQSKHKADKCVKCWLPPRICMCPIPPLSSPYRFGVYMHFKEYMNGSNTGKLLLSTPNARLFILGIEEQEKELVNWIADDLDRSIVLFPSRDSITVDQFKAKRPPSGLFTIIVLDGTWTQAKHLHSHLTMLVAKELVRRNPSLAPLIASPSSTSPPSPPPTLLSGLASEFAPAGASQSSSPSSPSSSPPSSPPLSPRSASVPSMNKVRLQPQRPSAFRARTQSQADRICTIEAVAMLLEELDGEKAAKDVAQLHVGLEEICDRAKGLGRKRVTP